MAPSSVVGGSTTGQLTYSFWAFGDVRQRKPWLVWHITIAANLILRRIKVWWVTTQEQSKTGDGKVIIRARDFQM
ncbi:hypothetical protein CDAR_600761 [Caerostris darwini]|uniref:Uncharacterized protein n=1 Tax=Caerostris darwini TaxID=1538125 RepID=A0AAV4TS09_9ARAC|nr:hypothetical protein CDAR_600761 [Caerostris darwini]